MIRLKNSHDLTLTPLNESSIFNLTFTEKAERPWFSRGTSTSSSGAPKQKKMLMSLL